MKPVPAAPNGGQITETVVRRRTLSEVQADPGEQTDYWQYVQQLSPADWKNHMLYLRRVEPQPPITLQRSGDGYFTMPSGVRVPSGDQEELEYALAQNYGGGTFKILLKRGSQLWKAANIPVGGAPRAITIPVDTQTNSSSSSNVTPMGSVDGVTQIAARAMDTIAGSEHQAVNLGLGMMSTAANVVKSFAENRSSAPSQTDQMFQMMMLKMMEKLIDRFDTPPPAASIVPGVGADIVSKMFGAIIDRGLNPQPAQAPVNATAEAIRNAPMFLQHLAELQREQRLAAEAQARLSTAGPRPVVNMPPKAVPALPATPAIQPPAPGGPAVEFVQKRIVEIFQSPISAEAAADSVMEYLDSLDPRAVEGLAQVGEEGLLQMFGTQPLLKACTNNMPRLVEFIRAFLRMFKEDEEKARQESVPKPN